MKQSKVQGRKFKAELSQVVANLSTILLAVVALLTDGCGEQSRSAKPTPSGKIVREGSTPNQDQSLQSATTKPAIDVQILSWDGTQKLVAGHKGKVVVLDVWSTSCEPCLREFPGLVALSQKFSGRVACISFNVNYDGSASDPPESHREAVLEFLTGQHARFEHVISSDPNEDFFNRIKLGGPPAVFVYDREGNLARRFDNSVPKQPEFTYEKDVVPLVERLLAGP